MLKGAVVNPTYISGVIRWRELPQYLCQIDRWSLRQIFSNSSPSKTTDWIGLTNIENESLSIGLPHSDIFARFLLQSVHKSVPKNTPNFFALAVDLSLQ